MKRGPKELASAAGLVISFDAIFLHTVSQQPLNILPLTAKETPPSKSLLSAQLAWTFPLAWLCPLELSQQTHLPDLKAWEYCVSFV